MRFAISLALVALSAALQFQALAAWLWTPDFLITALVVLAFFSSFRELAALLAFSLWLINWQPGVNLDAVLFMALPIAVWLMRKLLPWQAWMSVLISVGVSITAFYGTLHAWPTLVSGVFLLDLLFSLAYAGLIFVAYFGIIGYPWADRRRLFA